MPWSRQPVRRPEPLTPLCWICGAPADSGEHVFKRSDLVREHGPGPYRGDEALAHVVASTPTLVQGPGADQLKYRPSLCTPCNTTRTQPFDRAYDAFILWVRDHEAEILRTRTIDFENVYGGDWERRQVHLFKYFVKALGCRLVDAQLMVPEDLMTLLSQDHFQTGLCLTFVINMGVFHLPSEARHGFIGVGQIGKWGVKDGMVGYTWYMNYAWLWIYFWHGVMPEEDHGASIWSAQAKRKMLCLGAWQPLTRAQQKDLAQRRQALREPRQRADRGPSISPTMGPNSSRAMDAGYLALADLGLALSSTSVPPTIVAPDVDRPGRTCAPKSA